MVSFTMPWRLLAVAIDQPLLTYRKVEEVDRVSATGICLVNGLTDHIPGTLYPDETVGKNTIRGVSAMPAVVRGVV